MSLPNRQSSAVFILPLFFILCLMVPTSSKAVGINNFQTEALQVWFDDPSYTFSNQITDATHSYRITVSLMNEGAAGPVGGQYADACFWTDTDWNSHGLGPNIQYEDGTLPASGCESYHTDHTYVFYRNGTGDKFGFRYVNLTGLFSDHPGLFRVLIEDYLSVEYTVSGNIHDASGNPLTGINVTIVDIDDDTHYWVKTTDQNGNYAFSSMRGHYAVSAWKDGYTFAPSQYMVILPPNAGGKDFEGTNINAPPPAKTVYVALGDSYSSGEGDPPFIAGTDGPNNFCHRSKESAYSEVLSKANDLELKFYACSGATTDNIINLPRFGEPAQLTQPGIVDGTAGLVTITIGGNNAGFSSVLTSCIEQKLKADLFNAEIGQVAIWLGLGMDPSCANSQSFVDAVNIHIDQVLSPAKETYKALRDKIIPTGGSVIVSDYPHLFADSVSEQNCVELSFLLTAADQQFFNKAADRLDEILKRAASEAGVTFVDVRPTFNGHGICSISGSWINGLSIASGSGQPCTYFAFGRCIWSGLPVTGSFHPNISGHMYGYAAALQQHINSTNNSLPQGYLTTPLGPLSPSTTISTTAVIVQALSAQAVTTETAACEGTYQSNQQVIVSGNGFAPNASVQLYISAPGLSITSEQKVGQFKADLSGAVAGTFRIPLSTTGFAPTGSKAGFAFIDAIGLGPNGTHVDDTAIIGLVSRNNTCAVINEQRFNVLIPIVKFGVFR